MDHFNPNQKFDILNYLNDLYIAKVGPQINIKNAGGFHNIHDNQQKTDEDILEINKKRIHIPNAEIKQFSFGQQENFEEYNEPETDTIGDKQTKYDGKRRDEVSDETEQERGSSGLPTTEVIEI